MPDPGDLLAAAAGRDPGKAAVVCGDVRLSYPGLARLAGRIGAAIERAGARTGDRLGALFSNCHLYLATYFAAAERGVILVPINTRLLPREIESIVGHSGTVLVVGTPDRLRPFGWPFRETGDGWCLAEVIPTSPAGRRAGTAGGSAAGETGAPPGNAANLYYTSGTTGRPKGVVLTRGNLAAHTEMTLAELEFRGADVWLHAAPMFHLADAWAVWTATAAGATHVMLPRFDPAAALTVMRATGVTLTNLVPAMIPGVLDEARARGVRPALRLLLSGGAPIAPRLIARIEEVLGCEYAQTYGLTETSPFLTFSFLDHDQTRDLTVEEQRRLKARTGRPARGVSLRVVRPPSSDAFEDVPPDDAAVGEVVVRGATVTPGYWRDPEATEDAFRGGWFHTGDLGTLDARGSLNLVDRAKDVIVTGGESVYGIEVENALLEHPGVREAAVFGVPDDRWGEAVRAAVVTCLAGAPRPEDLIAFCRERIAAFKCPRAIDVLPELPRTGSGKIDKKALREPHWAGRARRVN
jgi:acyl-CoA synthetase (AMP-forming)/AMP-acid ligase II